VDDEVRKVRLLLAAALALVLPTLTLAGEAASTTVAGTLLAIALAAVISVAGEHARPGHRLSSDPVRPDRTRTPVALAGITDSPHHPQRPRAPGRL
jgi:hypothetical protein